MIEESGPLSASYQIHQCGQDSQKPLASVTFQSWNWDHGSLTLLVIIFSMLSFLAVSVFLFLVTHKLLANIHFAFWLFSVEMILYITCVYTGTQNILLFMLNDLLYMMVGQWVE